MRLVLLTPVRLLGDALAASFARRPDIDVVAVVKDLASLREALAASSVDLVLVDVTQGVELFDIRPVAAERPDVALLALGLNEQRQEVIRCGRAGFSGYVSRDATVDSLCQALADVMNGRQACSAEISGSLLRALFRASAAPADADPGLPLTRREGDVLQLIGRGLSNKEIARELVLSVATVKHHVHNILEKMHLPRRSQAMQRVRDAPWLVVRDRPPSSGKARGI